MWGSIEGLFKDGENLQNVRQGRDAVQRLVDVKEMQLDVLREALDARQDEVILLRDRKAALLTVADHRIEQPGPRALPRLPCEIIILIFSILYLADGPSRFQIKQKYDSTITRFVTDPRTPTYWAKAFRKVIPKIVSTRRNTKDEDVIDCQHPLMSNLLGPAPLVDSEEDKPFEHILMSGMSNIPGKWTGMI